MKRNQIRMKQQTMNATEKPLPGAVFTVTRLSGPESDNASDIGKVVATITTNAQGIAETGILPWGEYKIVETGVPEGYLRCRVRLDHPRQGRAGLAGGNHRRDYPVPAADRKGAAGTGAPSVRPVDEDHGMALS